MPTILREQGFRFAIYLEDHRPAHTHVRYQGYKVVIEFEDEISFRNNTGINRHHVALAVRIVERNLDFFWEKWREFYE